MNWVVDVLAAGSLLTALRAARLWYRSGQVKFDLQWAKADVSQTTAQLRQMDLNATLISAAGQSAALIGDAGLWTAVSVVLAALSSLAAGLTTG